MVLPPPQFHKLLGRPRAFGNIAPPKSSNITLQSEVPRKIYVIYTFLPIQVTKIERKLRDGDELLDEIFLT